MSRRRGLFVVQLDVQAGTTTTKTVKFDEPNTISVFWQRQLICGNIVDVVRPKQNLKQERTCT